MATDFWKKLVTAEGRERLQAEQQYELCEKQRASILRTFRQAAVTEVLMLHDDAQFVITDHSPKFFAMSESGQCFIVGHFADEFAPCLDWIDVHSKDTTVDSLRQAAIIFQNQFSNFMSRSKNAREHINNKSLISFERNTDPHELRLRANGYYFRSYDLDGVGGIGFSKNGRDTFKSGPSNHASLNALPKKIYEQIMLDTSGGKDGLSRLELSINFELNECEAMTDDMMIIYRDHYRASVDYEKDHLLSICQHILPFVTCLTSYMKKTEYDEFRLARHDQWFEVIDPAYLAADKIVIDAVNAADDLTSDAFGAFDDAEKAAAKAEEAASVAGVSDAVVAAAAAAKAAAARASAAYSDAMDAYNGLDDIMRSYTFKDTKGAKAAAVAASAALSRISAEVGKAKSAAIDAANAASLWRR